MSEATSVNPEVQLPTQSESPSLAPLIVDADINASPLHLHVGENAKLKGTGSRSSSRSRSHSRSRDQSPAISRSRTPSATRSRRNSNSSSVSAEDIHVDPDILTDKMGHLDLEAPKHVDIHSMRGSLTSVNERMSEETLEDCHAFSDLKDVIRQISKDQPGSGTASMISSRSSENSLSREGSMAGGSILGDGGHLLETLEEFEEEDKSSDEDEEEKDKTEHASNLQKQRLALLKKGVSSGQTSVSESSQK